MAVHMMPPTQAVLDGMPAKFRAQVIKRAEALGDNPRPVGWKKLEGNGDVCRVRQGAYRIFYVVQWPDVYVIGIGDRKEAYTKKGRR